LKKCPHALNQNIDATVEYKYLNQTKILDNLSLKWNEKGERTMGQDLVRGQKDLFGEYHGKPVNNGCILCGVHKGQGYGFLRANLYCHGGIKRICSDCKCKMRKEKNDVISAFHEAGHVVVILAMKQKFKYVTIDSMLRIEKLKTREDLLSHQLLQYPHVMRRCALRRNPDKLNNRNLQHVLKRLYVAFAGEAMIRILLKGVHKVDLSQEDFCEFEQLSMRFYGFRTFYYDRVFRHTKAILQSRLDMVKKIATALLERRMLTYEDVLDLIKN